MVVVLVAFVCGAEEGVTCARMCTMNLRPVCASDGQTYSKYGIHTTPVSSLIPPARFHLGMKQNLNSILKCHTKHHQKLQVTR